MKKTTAGKAAIAGSSAIAALLLSSCGGPALTMDGSEVKVDKSFVSGLETAWETHRQTQPASNTGDDAGCFVGAANGEMTGLAFCGPVHYLGDDETRWDEIRVDVVSTDGDAAIEQRGTFTAGSLDQDSELVRHDDRTAPREQDVPEPEAPNTAKPLTVFATEEVLPADTDPLVVALPEGTMSVTAAAVRERAGSSVDRTGAPGGFRIASVSFDAENLDAYPERGVAELSFQVDGTDYPVADTREGGTVSIAVPEDSKVSFAATFDGVTQSVNIPDLKLDSGDASALYVPKWASVIIEEKVTGDVAWRTGYANRSAHTPAFDLGWAGKDQVWIKASVNLGSSGKYAIDKGEGMKVVSAVMTTADGKELPASATDLFYWNSQLAWSLDVIYKAPADTAETIWNVTLEDDRGNVYRSGPMVMGVEEE